MALQVSPEKVYEACLVELHKTMRAASFYSIDHPALGQSLDRTVRYFQNLLRVAERLEFTIAKTQIFFNEKPLSGQPQVLTSLAAELFRRRVKKLIFLAGIEKQDLLSFLRAVKLDPEALVDKGGMESMLARYGVRTIFANEVNFQRLDDVDQQEEEEEDTEEEEIDFNLNPDQKALRELLHHMLRSDDAEFMSLLKEVVDKCKDLADDGEYAEIGVAVDYLFRFNADARKTVTAREFSEKAIRALVSKPVLEVKIQELGRADDGERIRLGMLFSYIGKLAIPFLLNALAVSEDRLARRNLAGTIADFGPKAVPYALAMLNDDRWFVKRNMLAILGEIGTPDLLGTLLVFVENEDVRVGKEATKTIGRVAGEAGLEALVGKLDEVEPGVQVQIALLFGARKWEPARRRLEGLAKKSNNSAEVRIAAIHSLGRIAAPESRSSLSRIFRARGFFRPAKRLPTRRAALRALVNYGQDVKPIMRKAVTDGDLEIQGIARLALEKLAGNDSGTEGA